MSFFVFSMLLSIALQAQNGYTLNDEPLPDDMAQMMYINGMPPGAYYMDEYGNFGMVGAAPFMNADGGPVRYSGPKLQLGNQDQAPAPKTQEPSAPTQNTSSTGLEGTRIFWVYSPSIFSSATGGASGFIHLCPGGVFYRSSEGSISVGGGYDSRTGANDSWAGAAHSAQSRGRWQLESGVLVLNDDDGGQQKIAERLISQGRWKVAQHKYAAERGRASCR